MGDRSFAQGCCGRSVCPWCLVSLGAVLSLGAAVPCGGLWFFGRHCELSARLCALVRCMQSWAGACWSFGDHCRLRMVGRENADVSCVSGACWFLRFVCECVCCTHHVHATCLFFASDCALPFRCFFVAQSNAQSARDAALRATLKERTEKLAAIEAEKAPPVVAAEGKASSGDPVQDWIDSLE